jgi:creatinine amidohydrolase
LTNLAKDILAEFLADGWQRILVLNGHFENKAYLIEASDLLLRWQETAFPKIVITDWYDNLAPELIPQIFAEVEFPGWELEHAAIVETSVMMYYAPELVREERILNEGLDNFPSYLCFPPSRTLIPESGCLHTARSSSADKGRLIVESVISNLEKIMRQEF